MNHLLNGKIPKPVVRCLYLRKVIKKFQCLGKRTHLLIVESKPPYTTTLVSFTSRQTVGPDYFFLGGR